MLTYIKLIFLYTLILFLYYRGGNKQNPLDSHVVEDLKNMIDQKNCLAKCQRSARDKYGIWNFDDLKIRLIKKRDNDGRSYNCPMCSKVVTMIVGGIGTIDHKDIIVENHARHLKQINELHPSYLALQYP